MRSARRWSKLFLLATCIFLTLIIVYRSGNANNLVIQVSREVDLKQHQESHMNENRLIPSRWKVLKDGTVIHEGYFKNSYNYSYIINNEKLCHNLLPKKLKVIIFVESTAINFKKREIIRNTWALKLLQDALNYRVVFLLGKYESVFNSLDSNEIQDKIMMESYTYGDVVQHDFVDSFYNLTLKSILVLKWYLEFCANAQFLFKTDDDIYIHVPNLLKELQNFVDRDNSILCHENKARNILRHYQNAPNTIKIEHMSDKQKVAHEIRKKIVKYSVAYDQLPGKFYPRYCAGLGYAMSLKVAQLLYQAVNITPYFFIEDVFITGFCREKTNVTITDTPHLNLRPVLSPHQGICAFQFGRINSNEMTVGEIIQLWKNINTQGYFCPKFVGFVNN